MLHTRQKRGGWINAYFRPKFSNFSGIRQPHMADNNFSHQKKATRPIYLQGDSTSGSDTSAPSSWNEAPPPKRRRRNWKRCHRSSKVGDYILYDLYEYNRQGLLLDANPPNNLQRVLARPYSSNKGFYLIKATIFATLWLKWLQPITYKKLYG